MQYSEAVVETMKCCRCGGDVRGSLEFIELSILCTHCCMYRTRDANSGHACFFSVPESYALQVCDVTAKDLQDLNYLTLLSSSEPQASTMKMYLSGEVRYLRNRKRKIEVENEIGLDLGELDEVVRSFLLGDYLQELRVSRTTLSMIRERRTVLERVLEIVKRDRTARPDSAFEFCYDHPTATADDFLHLKQSMCQAFLLEGHRILRLLPDDDRERLREGPLADVYTSFHAWRRETVLRGYLLQWFKADQLDEMMEDSSWKGYLWAMDPEDRVAAKLRDFWKEKCTRRAKLNAILTKRGLVLPDDCRHCRSFLNGERDYELKVLAGILDLRQRLKADDIDPNSPRGKAAVNHTIHCMEDLKRCQYDAVHLGMQRALTFVEGEADSSGSDSEADTDDDDDADYEFDEDAIHSLFG